jgi:hypothetical protein
VGVLNWFARLWDINEEEYWGYITNCGTEGNLHGILVGRENLPDGILYASKETHYSVFKAARMYRMDAVKVGRGCRGTQGKARWESSRLPGYVNNWIDVPPVCASHHHQLTCAAWHVVCRTASCKSAPPFRVVRESHHALAVTAADFQVVAVSVLLSSC